MNIYDVVGYLILIISFAVIFFVWLRLVQKWNVKVAVDDGISIRYVKADVISPYEGEDGKKYLKIRFKLDKRVLTKDVPYDPEHFRIMPFFMGIVKSLVMRVDKTGHPIGWSKTAPRINPTIYEQSMIADTIVNMLRRRAFVEKYMIYILILAVIVFAFAGIAIWLSASKPVIVNIPPINHTATPTKIPLPK
jgi:hypothetical protein